MLPEIDYFGAQGGSLGVAFAAGCLACWTFIKIFVQGPIVKLLKEQLALSKDREDKCEARVNQLEGLLFWHGGGEMQNAMQAALSEERMERIMAMREQKK